MADTTEKVIGYLSHFSDKMLEFHKLDPKDLIGAKFEMRFGKMGENQVLREETPKDIMDELVGNNFGICTGYDAEKSNAIVMFEYEMPLDVYKEYYDNEPILKSNTDIMTIQLNDNVVCVNDKPLVGNDVAPPLTEGSSYPVSEIHICGCGKQHIGVGLPMKYNWVKCYTCGEEMPTTQHWCHPSRFTK